MAKKLLSGNEAIGKGALEAGLQFYGGYPITPSSDIAEYIARELPKYGGIFIQMEDEIGSAGSIIGASLAGKKSMTATSGPGISLMQEHIGFAAMVEAPTVFVDIMRGGPSTGLPTFPSQGDLLQAKWGTHGDHEIIVLYPNSVTECFYQTVRAFNLAEKYRTPVIILSDEIIGHMREMVDLPEKVEVINRRMPEVKPDKFKPYDTNFGDVPPMPPYGSGYRYHTTGLVHDETGFPTHNPKKSQALISRLVNKIRKNRDDIVEVDFEYMDDAEIGIFALGPVARSALEAVEELRNNGVKAGLIRPKVVFPFCDKELMESSKNLKKLYVFEMNMGQIVNEVERVIGREKIEWHGKSNGEIITPDEIEEYIMGRK